MLNPKEDDHNELETQTRKMIASLEGGKESDKDFRKSHTETMAVSRRILKREWNVVKEKIETMQ